MVPAVVRKGAGAGELLGERSPCRHPTVAVWHGAAQVAAEPPCRVRGHAVGRAVVVGPLHGATGADAGIARGVGVVHDGHAGRSTCSRRLRATVGGCRSRPAASGDAQSTKQRTDDETHGRTLPPALILPRITCLGEGSTAGAGTPRSLVATPRGTPGRWGSAVPARSRSPGAAIPRAPATRRCAPPAAAGARRRFAWPARPPA